MKLTMRAAVIGKKVTLLSTAFILAVSSLTALGSFVLSDRASAIGSAGYTNVSLSSGWTVDRTAPSGNYGPVTFSGRQALELKVDAPSNAPSSFYQYEGVAKTVPNGTKTLKADLYVDPSWPENVRAGFWGVGYDNSGDISSYPIVEYNSAASSTNWRVWDSAGQGGWRDVSVSSASTGWNTVELALSKSDATKTEVYVNNVLVSTVTSDPTVDLRRIILNNYNFGTDDYSVRWSNIQTGLYRPDAPKNFRFTKDGSTSPVAAGSTVNDSNFTLTWDTVANADRYQVRVTDPSGATQENRQTGWYTFDLNDSTRYGFFGTKQGLWRYEVRTKDATSGLWSDYSAPLTLKFDSIAPSVSAKANDIALPENTPSDSVVYIPGTTTTTFQANLTDSDSAPQGAYIELFKANWDGTYGTWVKDNTNGSGNARYGASPKLVFNTSALSGKYGLKVVSQDTVGNARTTYHFFTIDSTYPAISFEAGTPAEGQYVKGTVPVNVKVVDSNAGAYHLSATGTGPTATHYVSLFYVGSPASGSINGYSWNTLAGEKAVGDGLYEFSATTVDKAGNRSTATRSLNIDNTKPTVTLTNPGDARFNTTAVLKVSANDGAALASVEASIYKAGNDTAAYRSSNANVSGNSKSYTHDINLTDLAEGEYYVQYSAADRAGNVSETGKFAFVVDTTAPSATFTHSNNNDKDLVSGPVTSTLKASEPIQAPEGWTLVENTNRQEFTKTSESNHKTNLKITDLAGNSKTVIFELKRIDRQAPTIEGVTSGATVRGAVTLSVFDPKDQGADGFDKAKGLEVNGAKVLTSEAAGKHYVYTITGDGQYTVTATDKAGNPTTINFTIDNSIEITFNAVALNVDDPIISGRVNYAVDGAPVADTNFVLAVDDSLTQYPIKTDAEGKFSTPVIVNGNGKHTVKLSRVNTESELAYVDEVSFVTALPVVNNNGNQGGGTNNGGNDNASGGPQGDGTLASANNAPGANNQPNGGFPLANAGSQVLGDATNNAANSGNAAAVAGTSTERTVAQAANSDANQGKFWGVAWYWWLLITAGVALLVWWIVAAVRHRQGGEA